MNAENHQELTGMVAVKAALQGRAAGERSLAWLGRKLGLSRTAALRWDKIPEEWLLDISKLTGLPARVLRPDLAELFAEKVA